MRQKIVVGVGFLLVVLLPGLAPAQTVYSDGLNHNISGSSSAIAVQNDGTTVTVLSGASVNGAQGVQGGAAIAGGAGTAINLLGGTVQGSPVITSSYIPLGIATSGSFSAFGGTVTGVGAFDAVAVFSGGTALIADGTFQGSAVGGSGLGFDGSSAQIFGGTFRGGGGGSPAVVDAGGNMAITGGSFQGGAYGPLGFGGSALSVVGSDGSVEISGGTFQAGQSLPGRSNNTAVFMAGNPNGSLSITGGVFEASQGVSGLQDALWFAGHGNTTANISGGLFSGSIELDVTASGTASFIGSGLLFNPVTDMLTGTLEDGSAISSLVLFDTPQTTYQYGFAPDGSGMVTFFVAQSVPEPSSVVMLLMGAACGAAVFVRKRRTSSSPEVAGG